MKAEDFLNVLEHDSAYQAMIAERKRRKSELDALLKDDEASLLEAIATASGVRIQSVWELVNSTRIYSSILELLADHLSRPYHFRTREGIARALTVKEVRGTRIPGLMLNELRKIAIPQCAYEESYRLSLINALVFVGDRSLLEGIRQVIADERFQAIVPHLKHLAKVLSRKSRAN